MQPPEEYTSLRIRTPPPDEEYDEKMKRTTQSFYKKCAERKDLCINVALLISPIILFIGAMYFAGIYS